MLRLPPDTVPPLSVPPDIVAVLIVPPDTSRFPVTSKPPLADTRPKKVGVLTVETVTVPDGPAVVLMFVPAAIVMVSVSVMICGVPLLPARVRLVKPPPPVLQLPHTGFKPLLIRQVFSPPTPSFAMVLPAEPTKISPLLILL